MRPPASAITPWSQPSAAGRSPTGDIDRFLQEIDRLRRQNSAERGEPAERPPFRDYVEWLHQQDDEPAERHWREVLGDFTEPTPLPFDRFDQLRSAMIAAVPALGEDGIVDMPWSPPKLEAKGEGALAYPIWDFYLTNAICRASPTMRRCSEELVQGQQYLEAAE